MQKKPVVPFDFVIEQLWQADPVVRPMFGCHAVYIGQKIIFILRQKESNTEDNGVWIATTAQYHEALKKDLPMIRSILAFGTDVTGWQNIPEEDPKFEEAVMHACELALKGDPRIGKVPKPKRKKKR